MSATHSKKTESKYVSCFADSRPDLDITFRDVLLRRPTDHYLVGVDNFSLTNSSLSMIEPITNGSIYRNLIRIVKNSTDEYTGVSPQSADDLDDLFDAGGNGVHSGHLMDVPHSEADFNLRIDSSETILNVQHLMRRLGQLAANVNEYMNSGTSNTQQNKVEFAMGGYDPKDNDSQEHLRFELFPQGNIAIRGTKAFWALFSIEIPSVRNQFGLYGPKVPGELIAGYTGLRQFLSVNPFNGNQMFDKILVTRFPKKIPTEPADGKSLADTQRDVRKFNRRCIGGSDPHYLVQDFVVPSGSNTNFMSGDHADSRITHTVMMKGSVFSSLERRIAIEIGCSLPVTNSPMIDHGKETPDFVLGRWIWRPDQRIASNQFGGSRQYEGPSPNCVQYQGPQDRVLYHELMAQAKIQTLRVRLFARLRTFNELTEQWGMRVIELPAVASDWWHARLHFISRD